MKSFVLSILTLFFACSLFSQKQANHWYFGENAGLNFTNATQNKLPVADVSGQLNTIEGCASISDINGDLLFYTDGTTVWDKNGTIMPHGTGLFGNSSSSQSAIIVPKPGDTNIYYIFTVDAQEVQPPTNNHGLNYYTVDLTLNGGNGDLVNNGGSAVVTNLIPQPSSEKITAVLAANKTDFWVITLKTNTFYAFKVTAGGVDASSPITSQFSTNFITDRRGYLKASPNGNFIATGNMRLGLYFYDFNNSTGIISNERKIDLPFVNSNYGPYGIAFSSLSKKLYTSTGSFDNTHTTEEQLYQFDLDQTDLSAANLANSKVLIHSYLNSRAALQLGPDGKIYRNVDGQSKLSVINNPDASGTAVNYQHAAIDLGGKISRQGLPPFIQSFLVADIQVLNTCFGDITSFLVNSTEPIIAMSTDFGDGTAPSSSLAPTHSYRAIGNYTASITITTASEVKTFTKDFSISQVPTATTPSNWFVFDDNNDGFYSFDFSQKDAEVLNGQDPTIFEVSYYTDAALTQKINRNYTNTTAYTAETIYASISNKSNFNCNAIAQFDINVFDNPLPATPENIPDLESCDNDLDGDDTNGSVTFDLTLRSTDILNGQSATDFDVAYFADAALTIPITNPTAYKNVVAGEQTIYVSVTNKLNTTYAATTNFKVVVHELPVINSVVTLKQCDVDTDGISEFNLSESNILINTQNPAPVFTYYLTLADAQLGDLSQSITNYDVFSNNTTSTIYTRVENSFGCYRVAQVNLLATTTQIPQNFMVPLEFCDNTVEDGIVAIDFTQATSAILNIFPSTQNLRVDYYRTTADALAEKNIIDVNNYKNEVPYSQNIVVRVESVDNNACVGLGTHVSLTVNKLPQFDLLESQFVCLNDLPLTVSVTNPDANYDYVWRNEDGAVIGNNSPSQSITKGGVYTVTATSTDGTHCSKTKSITINESVTATVENLNIVDDSDNNIIDVDITGTGIYEIALDDLNDFVPFTPLSSLPGRTHRFTNVVAGIHTVYIRDKNGCGLTIQQAIVIGFPRFLTPNGDGINDTWNVAGASLQPNSLIYIFDRFGKLIAKVDPTGPGWDGTFNGHKLPTSDYWFTARLQDGRLRKGHFSLVRR